MFSVTRNSLRVFFYLSTLQDLVNNSNFVFLGVKKFILVAHDWGGVVAWSFLDMYASMVDRYVILNAPHSTAWDKLMEIDKSQFAKAW